MSYILDALKKSERERRQREQGDLRHPESSINRSERRRPLWPYLIVAALLVNAAVFGLGPLLHSLTGESGVVTQLNEDTRPARPVSPSGSEKEVPEVRQSVDAPDNDAEESVKNAIPLDNRKARKEENPILPQRERAEGDQDSVGAESKKETPRWNPKPGKIYEMIELPSSVKETLPEFVISVFFYSEDPSSRIVRINGKSLREGEYLAQGVRIEEILPNSIVFKRADFRFKVKP